MPTTGSPSTANAMRVVKSGIPRAKATVPSIGSMIHCRLASPAVAPSSSPRIASPGNAARITSRITRSASRSASVTGEPSPLVSTATFRKRGMISKRARSQASCATRSASRSSAFSILAWPTEAASKPGGGVYPMVVVTFSVRLWAFGPRGLPWEYGSFHIQRSREAP